MFGTTLVASLFAAMLSVQGTNQPANSAWRLAVATPTYLTDGKVIGATRRFNSMVMNQPLVFYPHSGDSLCQSASATTDEPPDATNGWRVQVVPLRNSGNGVVLQVDWQRMWERGTKVTSPRGKAEVTIRPGQRITLDYITAGERALSSNMATEVTRVTGKAGCNAVGMELEIGLDPIERQELVEANLWLIRKLPDGTEQSQRQTIRARAGATVEFFFDDVTLSGAPVVAPGTTQQGTTREFFFFNMPVRTLGKIGSIDVVDGAVKLDLTIEQYLASVRPADAPPGRATGGSSTFPLTAKPDDVLSFQVPKITDDRLSLRIQVKRIR